MLVSKAESPEIVEVPVPEMESLAAESVSEKLPVVPETALENEPEVPAMLPAKVELVIVAPEMVTFERLSMR